MLKLLIKGPKTYETQHRTQFDHDVGMVAFGLGGHLEAGLASKNLLKKIWIVSLSSANHFCLISKKASNYYNSNPKELSLEIINSTKLVQAKKSPSKWPTAGILGPDLVAIGFQFHIKITKYVM